MFELLIVLHMSPKCFVYKYIPLCLSLWSDEDWTQDFMDAKRWFCQLHCIPSPIALFIVRHMRWCKGELLTFSTADSERTGKSTWNLRCRVWDCLLTMCQHLYTIHGRLYSGPQANIFLELWYITLFGKKAICKCIQAMVKEYSIFLINHICLHRGKEREISGQYRREREMNKWRGK